VIDARIQHREAGSVAWYLARARELDAHWAAHRLRMLVETKGRDVREIADEIVGAVGWTT
jgi:hypothetical protein